MPGALDGVTVLELGRLLAGPYCGQMLGDLGARVIKIERPEVGDESRAYGPPFVAEQSFYYLSLNRNKESVVLDLKRDRDHAVLLALAERADVWVHNWKPGSLEALGLGYEAVRARNDRIVYCAISGYGQSGPDRDRPSLDIIAQGTTGIMALTGRADQPPTRAGVAVSDITSGMFAAYAIVSALYARERTGRGQYVDTTLIESSIALLTYQAQRYFVTGEEPERHGNAHPSIVPYGCYRTADGWATVAVANRAAWERFCRAIDRPELVDDPRFRSNADRVRHREPLEQLLEHRLGELSTEELIARLQAAAVPCCDIRSLSEVFADPQVRHLGVRTRTIHPETGTIELTRPPYRMSDTPPELRSAPPRLGEHTEAILRELGLHDGDSEPE